MNNNGVPTFTPTTDDIPTFTPPTNDIPTFAPPPAPRPTFTGPACYHHPDERAVAKCSRCGKFICKECSEAFTVTAGEYADSCLCYDCCQKLVEENVAELKKNKATIMGQFILSAIGIIIGFIYGAYTVASANDLGTTLVTGFICGCIGGVFLSACKAFFSLLWDCIKIAFAGQFGVLTILSIIFNLIVIVFKCIGITVYNTIYYITYLIKTSHFIEEDTAALQNMKDFMEYTLVRNQNKGVDLESLMNEGSALYNNTYARVLRDSGEAAADAMVRQGATRISETGEIIRDFNNHGNRAA